MRIRFSEIPVNENFQYSKRWFKKLSDRQAKDFDTRAMYIFNSGDLVTKPDPDPEPDAEDDYDPLGAWIAAQNTAKRPVGTMGDTGDDDWYAND